MFQRLIQKVLEGLNPDDGTGFVAAYIDDILVYSQTLEEHLDHLRRVIARLRSANLKLKPSKCNFIRPEVEYLGHVITAGGLKTNPRLTNAVLEFPRPSSVHDVRRFLGMSSYYRRFIRNFSKIAQPLHSLTQKGTHFEWTAECDEAFKSLKERLATPPVLAFPSFDDDFTLETDASVLGLGVILSQTKADGRLHPVAYASRALNKSEKNYSITELETLAVVWAISHFHSYLYGNKVTILTDHSAVKAILETPNPTGKHARWWTRVYGRGVREVFIKYRAGRENVSTGMEIKGRGQAALLEDILSDRAEEAVEGESETSTPAVAESEAIGVAKSAEPESESSKSAESKGDSSRSNSTEQPVPETTERPTRETRRYPLRRNPNPLNDGVNNYCHSRRVLTKGGSDVTELLLGFKTIE